MDMLKWKQDLDAMASKHDHMQSLRQLVISYLESSDADDHKSRSEILILWRHLEKLFM